MSTSDRKVWPIWTAVAERHGEVIVADGAFSYGDGFHGVTGTTVYGVTAEMLQDRLDERNDLVELAEQAAEYGTTLKALRGMSDDEWLGLAHEAAEPEAVAAVRALPGYDEGTFPLLATSGGGRCFGAARVADYTTILDAALLDKINAYDDGLTDTWEG
jgi:hypothetical protein